MQAASSASLEVSHDSSLLKLVVESQRRLPNVMERRRITRVQIKNGLIGLCEIWDMGTPEVKFDGLAFVFCFGEISRVAETTKAAL